MITPQEFRNTLYIIFYTFFIFLLALKSYASDQAASSSATASVPEVETPSDQPDVRQCPIALFYAMSEIVDRSGAVKKPRQPIFELLEQGADPNCVSTYPTHPKGLTPLMFAAHKGLVIQLIDLLKRNANINANDQRGYTALDYAIAGDKKIDRVHLLAVAKKLLDKGADFNHENSIGSSIVKAVCMNFTEAVQLLLEKGAGPNSFSKSGKTLLFIAASNGNKEIVELLLRYGANPKVENKILDAGHGKVSNAVQAVVNVLSHMDVLMPNTQAPSNQIVWRKPEEIAWANGHHDIVDLLQRHASSSSSPSSTQEVELDTLHTPLLQNSDEAGAS